MHSACFNRRPHTGCGHAHLLHVASIFCFIPRTTQDATFWVVPCIVIMLVSIHAHTQGATNLEFACTYPARRFNPRTHTGCDPIALYARLAVVKFQSTHPHGVRRKGNCYLLDNGKVSIHAPTRGATIAGRMLIRRIGFQSTHPHGVRRCNATH